MVVKKPFAPLAIARPDERIVEHYSVEPTLHKGNRAHLFQVIQPLAVCDARQPPEVASVVVDELLSILPYLRPTIKVGISRIIVSG